MHSPSRDSTAWRAKRPCGVSIRIRRVVYVDVNAAVSVCNSSPSIAASAANNTLYDAPSHSKRAYSCNRSAADMCGNGDGTLQVPFSASFADDASCAFRFCFHCGRRSQLFRAGGIDPQPAQCLEKRTTLCQRDERGVEESGVEGGSVDLVRAQSVPATQWDGTRVSPMVRARRGHHGITRRVQRASSGIKATCNASGR